MPASSLYTSIRAGRRWAWRLLAGFPLALAGVCWWLTAPLEDPASHHPSATARAAATGKPALAGAGGKEASPAREFPEWPEGKLEGDEAKRCLLDTLRVVRERLEGVDSYTATFKKRERINGVLGPEQVLAMKVRQHPFAVYFKYLSPVEGKEAVYAEGQHENKVIAHSGGLARLLVPRLAVAPDHPLAMAETRHAITEAGLTNLVAKLIDFRVMDLTDTEAVTILDRVKDAQGRLWLRSVHEHPEYDSRRPFARVEVLYDPQNRLPLQIRNEDWPRPGHEGEFLLAEHYIYEHLDLDADLTALDFDPANPAYGFRRY